MVGTDAPAGTAERLLEALDPEQRDVALALQGPVRVLAGAGTGKTRALTHRIAYGVATGVYNPTEVLAVTFTTRAAGEMRTRLRSLGAGGVQARTFHSPRCARPATSGPGCTAASRPSSPSPSCPCSRWPHAATGSTSTRPRCATSPARWSGPRSATSAPTTTPGSAPPAVGR